MVCSSRGVADRGCNKILAANSPFHVVYRHWHSGLRAAKKTGWRMNKKFDMIWERLVLSTRHQCAALSSLPKHRSMIMLQPM